MELQTVKLNCAWPPANAYDLLAKVLRYDLSLAVVMRMALKEYISKPDDFDTMIWAVLEIDAESNLGYWPQVPADRRSSLDQRGEVKGFGYQIARLQGKRDEKIERDLDKKGQ